MTRTPASHRARGHADLLAAMELDAKQRFADADRPWDPVGSTPGSDPGQGVLDVYAAALDVLWGYQHAWVDECYLPTAQLAASTTRLLSLVGHRPRPALSATGLSHLQLKAGTSATLPAGFAVGAPATASAAAAVYETAVALRADARLNRLQPFLAAAAAVVELPPVGVGVAPPVLHIPVSGGSLAEQLAGRVNVAQRGAAQARDAARARADALKLADLATTLADAGAADACADTFTALCDELCEQAHALVAADAQAVAQPLEPLTEAQHLVLGALARVDATLPAALANLELALGRQDSEDDATYAARLDGLAGFLDALVEGILTQARDDVARLHGPRALTALERTQTGLLRPGELGTAEPGSDRLYLMPQVSAEDGVATTHAGLLRPGDWLILAELVEVAAGEGGTVRQQRARQAVRVQRVDDQVAPSLGERATHVVFTPPLVGRYDLASTIVLGNIVPVSHGRTVRRMVAGPGPWPLELDLAWLPDEHAPDGRVPAVTLSVAGEPWSLTTDVTAVPADARVFAVDVAADGRPVLRTGDGLAGATIPPGAAVVLSTRVGTGAAGNRDAGAINQILSAVPEVVATSNPLPLAGGADAEDPAVARHRATSGVQTLDRAVTPGDIEALLLGHGLVARAAVRRDTTARRRHLVVVLSGQGGRVLTGEEHALVQRFLAARVPPGLSLRTVDRRVITLRASLLLAIHSDADALAVIAGARERLGVDQASEASADAATPRGLLHPDMVRLGQAVHLSDLHAALEGLPGLAWVVVEALHRDGETPRRAAWVALADDEEPRWAADTEGLDGVALRWEEAVDR